MVKPIPKKLLIHNVEYYEYDSESSFQNSYKTPVTISYVRLEPQNKVVNNTGGESITSKAVLFVDVVNSTPIPNFVEKSKVVWKGKEMYIQSIDELFADTPIPHHWELNL